MDPVGRPDDDPSDPRPVAPAGVQERRQVEAAGPGGPGHPGHQGVEDADVGVGGAVAEVRRLDEDHPGAGRPGQVVDGRQAVGHVGAVGGAGGERHRRPQQAVALGLPVAEEDGDHVGVRGSDGLGVQLPPPGAGRQGGRRGSRRRVGRQRQRADHPAAEDRTVVHDGAEMVGGQVVGREPGALRGQGVTEEGDPQRAPPGRLVAGGEHGEAHGPDRRRLERSRVVRGVERAREAARRPGVTEGLHGAVGGHQQVAPAVGGHGQAGHRAGRPGPGSVPDGVADGDDGSPGVHRPVAAPVGRRHDGGQRAATAGVTQDGDDADRADRPVAVGQPGPPAAGGGGDAGHRVRRTRRRSGRARPPERRCAAARGQVPGRAHRPPAGPGRVPGQPDRRPLGARDGGPGGAWRGVPVGPDDPVLLGQPVAPTIGGGGDGHDRRRGRGIGGVAGEDGTGEGGDGARGRGDGVAGRRSGGIRGVAGAAGLPWRAQRRADTDHVDHQQRGPGDPGPGRDPSGSTTHGAQCTDDRSGVGSRALATVAS